MAKGKGGEVSYVKVNIKYHQTVSKMGGYLQKAALFWLRPNSQGR